MKVICLFALSLVCFKGHAQNDTSEVNRLFEKCDEYRYSNQDSVVIFANIALKKAKEIDYKYGVSKAYWYLGDIYLGLTDFSLSNDYLDSAIAYSKEHHTPKIHVDALNIKGILYSDLSQFDKSIAYYEEGKELATSIDYPWGLNIAVSNLGVSYYYKGDLTSSLKYFLSALNNYLALEDTTNYLICLGNVASIYEETGQYNESLNLLEEGIEMSRGKEDYIYPHTELLSQKAFVFQSLKKYKESEELHLQVLAIKKEINDWKAVGRIYNNLGDLYFETGQVDKAISYSDRSIEIADSLGNERDLAAFNKSMAVILNGKGLTEKAYSYAATSISVSERIGSMELLMESYLIMAQINAKMKNFEDAYQNQIEFLNIKDSMNRVDSEQSLEELSILHHLDKKDLENEKLMEENEKERIAGLLKDEQHTKDQNQKIFLSLGLVLLLGLAVLILFAYRNKKKSNDIISLQKVEIEKQHHILGESHKEITDSINYAKRLQDAILPPLNEVQKALAQSFILFLPKDVVSGDFYWMEENDNSVFIAAADCTGHGVPGAMVSVVCSNALHRSVNEFGISSPSKILDKTRELVIETFAKSGEEVKDGMDIALCAFDKKRKLVTYAGANNPLWIARKIEHTSTEEREKSIVINDIGLIELKPSKQPVGLYAGMKDFTEQKIELFEGDTLYFFTDGFADQFGGPKGKKMKYKPFKRILLEMNETSMKEQHNLLSAQFSDWKGDIEQLDDVCVIGVKV